MIAGPSNGGSTGTNDSTSEATRAAVAGIGDNVRSGISDHEAPAADSTGRLRRNM